MISPKTSAATLSTRASSRFDVQPNNTTGHGPSCFINCIGKLEQTVRPRCDYGHTQPIFGSLDCVYRSSFLFIHLDNTTARETCHAPALFDPVNLRAGGGCRPSLGRQSGRA